MERPWNLEKRPSGFDQASKRIRSGSSGGDEENRNIVAEAECGQSRICRWHDAERDRRDDLHRLYPGEARPRERDSPDTLASSRISFGLVSARSTRRFSSVQKTFTSALGKWLIPDSWVSRKSSSTNT